MFVAATATTTILLRCYAAADATSVVSKCIYRVHMTKQRIKNFTKEDKETKGICAANN
jgi:hypothetical protein